MSAIAATEVRDNLSSILDEVIDGQECVITRHGRPVAIILDIQEYESMLETLNILSDDDTVAALAEAAADLDEGRVSEGP
jgi:antitoxin YefM